MMIRTKLNTMLLTASAVVMLGQSALAAGYEKTYLNTPHRDAPLALHIYYPDISKTGTDIELGKNAVFKGAPVSKNSDVSKGPHPIIMLSHGSGGNGRNLAWIAGYLADQGFLVLAPDHAGTTSGDSTPKNTVKLWERTADFTALLDQIEEGGLSKFHPDLTDITSLGFSLGGHTALALAGARVSSADYATYCDRNKGLWDCAWLESGDIDLSALDNTRFEGDMSDPRVDRVIAIDPALAQAYTHQSLATIKQPVHLLNLGMFDEIPAAVNAKKISKRISNVSLQHVPDAWHFSFLGECTKFGGLIIGAVGEDPICDETAGGDRNELHERIKPILTGYLSQKIPSNE